MHRRIFKVLLVSACLLAVMPTTLTAGVDIGHPSKPVKGFSYNFERWPWPLHAEVCDRLQELANMYPKLARTHIIGKSREGRDLMVMEITNSETGSGISKPGMWMDGNVHLCYTGRLFLMYFMERLLFEYGIK